MCKVLLFLKSKNIIHRDLKLENIMLNIDGDIKIIDFGLATMLNTMSLMASSFAGTPITTAPEIIEGKKYDSKVDIFSTGCILYELYIGLAPYFGRSPEEVYKKILEGDYPRLPEHTPEEISEVIYACLKNDPEERITLEGIMDSRFLRDYINLQVQNEEQNVS